MYEFLEGHGLIQMILLILFIGLQFKLSLKKDGNFNGTSNDKPKY